MYLTGATLFLSLLLSRVFYIILDFIHVQEEFTLLQSKVAKQSGATGEANEMRKRIDELELELAQQKKTGRDFGQSPCSQDYVDAWRLVRQGIGL